MRKTVFHHRTMFVWPLLLFCYYLQMRFEFFMSKLIQKFVNTKKRKTKQKKEISNNRVIEIIQVEIKKS